MRFHLVVQSTKFPSEHSGTVFTGLCGAESRLQVISDRFVWNGHRRSQEAWIRYMRHLCGRKFRQTLRVRKIAGIKEYPETPSAGDKNNSSKPDR